MFRESYVGTGANMNINQTLVTNLSNREILHLGVLEWTRDIWYVIKIPARSSKKNNFLERSLLALSRRPHSGSKKTLDGLEILANQLRLVVTGCFERMYFAITGGFKIFWTIISISSHELSSDKKNQFDFGCCRSSFLETKKPKTPNWMVHIVMSIDESLLMAILPPKMTSKGSQLVGGWAFES